MDEKILEKINIYQEILSTMPKNNAKNIEKYNEKIEEILKEYREYQKEILQEMQKRYEEKYKPVKNLEIEKLEKEISNYEDILEILGNVKTSYQRANLDKEVYKLGKYYKENLENVNNQIMTCVNIYRNIGIQISEEDFSVSQFAEEYMRVFFEEMKKGDVNSEIIKAKFEELYWKCPDIIIHIEVSINNIYLKYKKEIDKYFENKKQETLKRFKINEESIIIEYAQTKKNLDKIKNEDENIILSNFLNEKYNINDYTEEKINKIYTKYLNTELIENIKNGNVEKVEEINTNIIKFINSIYEYKNYLKYKFIFDNVKEKFAERDKNKLAYKDNLKAIDNYEKNIRKNNKAGIFSKKDANSVKNNELILKLKDEYKLLSENLIYNKIAEDITETSTILDVFKFASSFYKYLVGVIIEHDKEITQSEIDDFLKEFIEYVKFPYFTILNNITILDEKDIALIIKDRYKLLNFNIEKEDITENNLDNLLTDLEKIKMINNIRKAGLSVEEIQNLCEYKKILSNN